MLPDKYKKLSSLSEKALPAETFFGIDDDSVLAVAFYDEARNQINYLLNDLGIALEALETIKENCEIIRNGPHSSMGLYTGTTAGRIADSAVQKIRQSSTDVHSQEPATVEGKE